MANPFVVIQSFKDASFCRSVGFDVSILPDGRALSGIAKQGIIRKCVKERGSLLFFSNNFN